VTTSDSSSSPPQALAIITNTLPLETPADLNDFSSHRVLWDTLRAEIMNNPFIVGADPQKYLMTRLKQAGFSADQFPVSRFITQLMYPAIAQSLATMLIKAQLPLKLYGMGWDSNRTFSPYSAGAIGDRSQFDAVLRQPIALVDVWPGIRSHPARAMGRPFLAFGSSAFGTFAGNAKRMLNARTTAPTLAAPRLSPGVFREILSTIPV